jgi:molybdopterin-guanine dinucleotide biosynthesis protein A
VDALIAILAGGRGDRIGGGKPTLELGGRPLIEYAVSAAVGAGCDVAVFAKPQTDLPRLRVRIAEEPAEPRHPLCGIVAALRDAERPVIAMGCDLPFVAPELLAWLAKLTEPVAVPEAEGRLQPLLARYDPSALGPLELALERRAPLQETVRGLGPRVVPESELRTFGDPARLLFNVNTRDDLAAAESLLASR